jgi:hypothetical protein
MVVIWIAFHHWRKRGYIVQKPRWSKRSNLVEIGCPQESSEPVCWRVGLQMS